MKKHWNVRPLADFLAGFSATRGVLPAVSLAVVLGGCVTLSARPAIDTVPQVDLARYAGTWYEIARLPMWFQRECVASQAHYTPLASGTISVKNECTTITGTHQQAEGIARVVDPGRNSRLNVAFDNWFARLFGSSQDGNYWILSLDPDYQRALVGTPDRRYLWILSRRPTLDTEHYEAFVQVARQLGYPVEDLIQDHHPTTPSP
jgi:apolipoprotein D and lipocalin family protein